MAEYIDRDAVYHAISVDGGLNAYEKAYCIDIVRKIPAADVAPVRHGQWVAQDETRTKFMCSVCESKNHGGHEKFCPNCGAKNDGGDKNDE